MRLLFLTLAFFLSMGLCPADAKSWSISKEEKNRMTDEAENWIDDIPVGLQDRLSDAVAHAQRGFFNELNFFRNMADTTGVDLYSVKVTDFKGGKREDIQMRCYTPSQSLKNSDLTVLIYFHGGGWSLGSIATSDKFCRALASQGNVKVISVDYPLTPENPYPSALNTCVEAVEFIVDKMKEQNHTNPSISLGGEGAGGNLALETFLQLQKNEPGCDIKSIVAYYPLLKTSGELTGQYKKEFGRGYGFDSRVWEVFIDAYKDSSDNLLQTGLKFPPILLISPGRDIVFDEAKIFSENNKEVKFIEFTDSLHGFISDGHQPTAFNKAVELTDLFLTEKN